MRFVIRKQHQILNSIIEFISVYVMDYFFRREKSSEVRFHYESMFRNAFVCVGLWVVRSEQLSVAVHYPNATLPTRVVNGRSIKSRFSHFFDGLRRIYGCFSLVPWFHNADCSLVPRRNPGAIIKRNTCHILSFAFYGAKASSMGLAWRCMERRFAGLTNDLWHRRESFPYRRSIATPVVQAVALRLIGILA